MHVLRCGFGRDIERIQVYFVSGTMLIQRGSAGVSCITYSSMSYDCGLVWDLFCGVNCHGRLRISTDDAVTNESTRGFVLSCFILFHSTRCFRTGHATETKMVWWCLLSLLENRSSCFGVGVCVQKTKGRHEGVNSKSAAPLTKGRA